MSTYSYDLNGNYLISQIGGGGGSTVIPDPSGRKDRFDNPVYVPKSQTRKGDKK